MLNWGTETYRIREALQWSEDEPQPALTPEQEQHLFDQGYLTSEYENRQNVLRQRARDERMLRHSPPEHEPVLRVLAGG